MIAFLALPDDERNAIIDESIAEMQAQTARIREVIRWDNRRRKDHAGG
jgi:hypothetical protein